MPNLVSPQALKMMAEEKEVNITELRDKVALTAFNQILGEIRERQLDPDVDFVAKRTWDFTDAFMRERYERECIARSGMKANIPDHLGQLNL